MAEIISDKIKMLEELIVYAAWGKKITVQAKPMREIVEVELDAGKFDMVILFMEYTGTVDNEPFQIIKHYSFTDEAPQDALESLLVANNRLQYDYERLQKAGIQIDPVFFTFVENFMDLTMQVPMEISTMRLQHFIDLNRAGIPVSVDVKLQRPTIFIKQEGKKIKGFGCLARFDFDTGMRKTKVEKLYGIGPYDDARKKIPVDVVEVANKRLERDCHRLKQAGISIEIPSFWYIWEKVFNR